MLHVITRYTLACSLAASATTALAQAPDGELPASTEIKLEAVSQEIQELNQLTGLLKELGDPTQRRVGEKAADYLKRVDRILKARAVVLELVGQHMERLLDSKFKLEEQLAEYEAWAKKVNERLNLLPEKYNADAEKLEARFTLLKPQVAVLAKLIYDELPDEARQAGQETEEAQDLKVYFNVPGLLDGYEERSECEARFAPLTLKDKRQKLDELVNEMVDIDFEVDLLNKVVIVETDAFADVLPDAHREVIEAATQLLRRPEIRQLDDRAAQVAILAKYAKANLKLVQPDGNDLIEIASAAQQLQNEMPQLDAALQILLSGKVSSVGRRNIMNRKPAALSPTRTESAIDE